MGRSMSDKVMRIVAYAFLAVFALVCLYPLVLTLSVSLSSETEVVSKGYSVIPQGFTFDTYRYIFENSGAKILRSYGVTTFVTVVGTISSLVVTSLIAYALSMKKLRYRNKIAFICNFTIIFPQV